MTYRRCGRSGLQLPPLSLGLWQNFGDDRAARDAARDHPPRLRPRHHPLRPGQQLRPAVRLRRDQLRPDLRRGPRAATATSSSSRPRPAGTCGPARTATSARASTCSPASTSRCSRMGLDYVDIFYSHRFDPDTPLEETMGALDTAVRPGQGALRRHLVVLRRAHPRGRRDPARPRHAAADPPAVVLDAQPLDRARPARRARRGRRRLHRLHRAGPGPADRQVPRRHPRGLARGAATRTLDQGHARRRDARPGPRPQRDRRAARSVAGADGAGLGAARRADDVAGDRREQRRAARGERRRARQPRLHRRRARRRSTSTPSTPASTSGKAPPPRSARNCGKGSARTPRGGDLSRRFVAGR